MRESREPRRGAKFARRRDELARAALITFCERGYARTSLRDIAEHSGFTTGLLHYYFADREELLVRCVELYRGDRTGRLQDLTETAADIAGDGPLGVATQQLSTNARWSRFYYDIRAQSMFEPYLRDQVAEMERERAALVRLVIDNLAAAQGCTVDLPLPTLYAIVDGLFEKAVRSQLAGAAGAIDELATTIRDLVDRLAG